MKLSPAPPSPAPKKTVKKSSDSELPEPMARHIIKRSDQMHSEERASPPLQLLQASYAADAACE